MGIDPTADSLHVGHLIQLVLMTRLQRVGHIPICLFGGGTALIGDPSGKNDMRKMLTKEELDYNISNLKQQVADFMHINELKIVNNADWLCDLNYIDFLREIGVHFSVNRMLAAECYKQRLEEGLTFFELNYMIMQSYDFFVLHRDYNCILQIGGDDQWSNILFGADLIRRKTGTEAYAMTTKLFTTFDGVKMGKTAGGALWLNANKVPVYDFFQYWRNVNDADVIKCFNCLTLKDVEDISDYEQKLSENINEIKEILAFEITSLVHGAEEAAKALKAVRAVFTGTLDSNIENIPVVYVKNSLIKNDVIRIVELLTASGLAQSNSDAIRLINQGGICANGIKISDQNHIFSLDDLKMGVILQKGKKRIVKCMI
ncbi:MAG: tyrosine--tRNA ligase [Candidatus Improbicoccus devescovinae]|nr:MAG: tyrosine--tRNA ligase [Candidatus Improbicoccus devescovinae]